MKLKFKIFFILILFIFVSNTSFAKKNKILLKIDNEIITSIDLLQESTYLKAINSELNNLEENIIYEISKKSLIRKKIKEIELKKKLINLDIDELVLNKLLLESLKRLNINSENELNNFLIQNNLNKNYIKNKVKIDVLWNEYIYVKYSKNIKIDKKKIKKNLQDKEKQNEYLLSEILFNVESDETYEKKLNKIQQSIKIEGFSKAALKYSLSNSSDNGGEIGWINENSINEKIRTELNKVQIDNYTKPIVVPGGFLILKVNKKRISESILNLEKSVEEIAKKLANEQLNQFSNIHYNKTKKNIIINEF